MADDLMRFRGVNMLCGIGNGSMNVMYINNSRPIQQKCFTEKYGAPQCMIAIWGNLMRLYVVGGGGCTLRHFGDYDHGRATIIDDI